MATHQRSSSHPLITDPLPTPSSSSQVSSPFNPLSPTQLSNLTLLLPSSFSSTTPLPSSATSTNASEDSILTALHARSRADLPYTWIGSSTLLLVNPLRNLSSSSDLYSERYAKDTIQGTNVADEDDGRGSKRRKNGGGNAGANAGIGKEPHLYALAGRVWGMMVRRKEDQAVVYTGLVNSGKSHSLRLITHQLLRLSTSPTPLVSPPKLSRLGQQVSSLLVVLDSFGSSKKVLNNHASGVGKWLELFFDKKHGGNVGAGGGRLIGAKVLTFGLDKSRLIALNRDERSFHVFYQLLAGASGEERDALNLEDPSSYTMLAKSGCFRLPGGPFSDDSTQFDELRIALANLGFKAKHLRSMFGVLVTILLLGNLEFEDTKGPNGTGQEESCAVAYHSREVLSEVSQRLGIDAEELEGVLTNETRYLRKDTCSLFLDAKGAERQRDTLVKNLYAILVAFVVETANRKLAPQVNEEDMGGGGELDMTKIVQLDLIGIESGAPAATGAQQRMSVHQPLVLTTGYNGVETFTSNLANEILQSYLTRRVFEDDIQGSLVSQYISDGIEVSRVDNLPDPTRCVELLRGGAIESRNQRLLKKPRGLLGSFERANIGSQVRQTEETSSEDDRMLGDLVRSYGIHGAFIVNPPATDVASGYTNQAPMTGSRKHLFGINHYSGPCIYDVDGFIEKNSDVIDAQLVNLLRSSKDSFVAKLVSGPSIAAESHPLDENIIVQAQVPIMPLRRPTRGDGNDDSVLDGSKAHSLTTQMNASMTDMLTSLDDIKLWNVICIRPNDSGHPNSIDKRRVKEQIKTFLLPELVIRKQRDYIADQEFASFAKSQGLRHDSRESLLEAVKGFAESQGWEAGRDYAIGGRKIWLSYDAWKQADDIIKSREGVDEAPGRGSMEDSPFQSERGVSPGPNASRYAASTLEGQEYPAGPGDYGESAEDLLMGKGGYDTPGSVKTAHRPYAEVHEEHDFDKQPNGEYIPHLDGSYPPEKGAHNLDNKEAGLADMVVKERAHVEIVPTTTVRKWWVRITWALTWFVPSYLLDKWGGMKRPDVRMAWREKLAIFEMIIGSCGFIIFYIVVFGKLLCPNSDKAWNTSQLAEHTATNDYYAAIRGYVYDFTKFYKGQHSDITAYPTSSSIMLEFAGLDLTNYFPMPLTEACPNLVTNSDLVMSHSNWTAILDYAVHTSGPLQTANGSALSNVTWYEDRLQPYLKGLYKGYFVWDKSDIAKEADDGTKTWFIYDSKVYDLTDYFYTIDLYSSSSGTDVPNYSFLNADITDLVKDSPGTDLTDSVNSVLENLDATDKASQMNCLNNAFYLGETDFRKTARCLVQNYLLLAFTIILMITVAAKFLAALQLSSKRSPELSDKFVLCQVPCYTEGEESLRRTIDSLAALEYDDKRKLIFVICDGNIIGSGNDRTTPRIVLDILGVDPEIDPEPLMFKSIGDGSKQLNYGKVYSGLYEFEGHIVPYMVIVKVGKPSERSKPGNRGKRDSQILLLHYLNRVHFDGPMSPLELEMYHQMRNVIGIDPAFYEYIFQVDADTTVTPQSLNRMVAISTDDSKIIGICGETKLANERQSLTTMIQVYEYYISHHLTKAFESLFGSVTCLPGCFSLYRIRTADKGRPIIISSGVIDEYSENNVDTLHKKNLFSLGEDRYLTTLMMKHFPSYKMKFTQDAIAHTVAPDKWAVLLSQRRRWINSTVHNLVELLFLPELCGFCLFSLRFFVFIDLLGTIILPATCVYLLYLIIVVATGNAALPTLSLIMIGVVYGLQAIIFILKREFQLIGWMFIYLLAFPVYSFWLPLYSFWQMDNHSWGNTRMVAGEGSEKKIIADADDHFDDSMIPLKRFSEYEQETWENASNHEPKVESDRQSVVSSATSKPDMYRGRRNGSRSNLSQAYQGDYYRDSSPMGQSQQNLVNPNLRTMSSQSTFHPHSMYAQQDPRVQSMAGLSQWGAGSNYGGMPMMPPPHNPFVNTAAPSEYSEGGGNYPMPNMMGGGMGMGSQNPFMMGMQGAPRNTMMMGSQAGFDAGSVFNGGGNRAASSAGGLHPPAGIPRPQSTFSMATSFNAFDAPPPPPDIDYNNSHPSDDDIINFLSFHLSTQDLMVVTKKKVREAVFAKFGNADLSGKTSFINENIDRLLSA